MSGLYVAGGSNLYQYALDGTPNWTKSSATHCTADAAGNVYMTTSAGDVTKYDIDGTEIWTRSYHSAAITGIAVDSAENVTITHARLSNITHKQYDSAGGLNWSKDHGGTLNAVAVDEDDNVYVGGVVVSSVSLRSYTADGTVRWTASLRATAETVSVRNGRVCVGGARNATYSTTHRVFATSDGASLWDGDHGTTINGSCWDAAGNLYVCGIRLSSVTTRKYNSSGTLQWSRDYNGTTCRQVSVDTDGNAYIGSNVSTYSLRKYNSAGSEQWAKNIGTVADIVQYAGAIAVDVPGLALALALGVPAPGFIYDVPGLALSISLGVPTVPDFSAPEIVGNPRVVSAYYRALVTGGDPLDIPLSSIQCRRRRGDSTWLTITSPSYSTALHTLLKARRDVGAELLILAGARYSDGSSAEGEFLRAALTEVNHDGDARDWFFTLVARVIPAAYSNTTRALYGVTQRGKTADGKRTAQCTVVDPLLRPGDTVADGAAEWEAGAILYRIDPYTTLMTVTED